VGSNLPGHCGPASTASNIETALKHTARQTPCRALLAGRNTLTRKIKGNWMNIDGADERPRINRALKAGNA